MVLSIPNGFAQVAFLYSLTGDAEEMVTTVGCDFATMSGSDQANANSIRDSWASAMGGGNTGWTYLGVRCRVGTSGGTITVESPAALVGAGTGATLPQNCAFLVKKSTALAGRSGRGRMYLPPAFLAEGNVSSNGLIDTTQLGQIQTNLNLALSSSIPWVLLHTVESGLAPTPITGFTLDRQLATQRRRLR